MHNDADGVRDIVRRCGWNVTSWQILNPGFTYWVHPRRDAVVGYVQRCGVRVVGGAPVCADEDLEEVVSAFENDASAEGAGVIYFAAERRIAELACADARRVTFPIGAQPFWDPGALTRAIRGHASLRAQLNRARNKGVTTREVAELDATTAGAMQTCLAEWIRQRPLPPLHFLIETETLRDIADRRLFVAELDGIIVGFLVATPVPARGAWLIEQIVRGESAPNGTVELLLDRAAGTLPGMITLGLAPLARRGTPVIDRAPRWVPILLARLRSHGRRYFNFEGLERFKAKFGGASWDVVYASVAPGTGVSRALLAVTTAFSGESLLPFAARTVRRRLTGTSAGN